MSNSGIVRESMKLVAKTLLNPLFIFGVCIGGVVGWALCWAVFVMPFHRNLSEREAQLEHWSQLNQQLQQITMDNRAMSQVRLKQFIAANQESAAAFAEVQRRLHERELRLTETPVSYVLVPIGVLGLTIAALLALLKALNQRALATIEQVMHMTSDEMVQEVLQRHLFLARPESTLNRPPPSSLLATRAN